MRKRENAAEPRWDEKNNRWILQVQVNGKRTAVTSSKPGKAGITDCKRKQTRVQNGLDSTSRIKDAWVDYLADVANRRGEDSNAYRSAAQIGRTNILPAIGMVKVDRITEQQLQEILNTAKPKLGKGELSRKTVANIRAEINLFFKYLKRAGLIDWRPDTLEIPTRLKKLEKGTLSREEMAFLLNDSTSDPYILAWQFIAMYGLRPGEAYGLMWKDLSEDQFVIRRSYNARLELTPGKNTNARRSEKLFDHSKRILSRAQEWQLNNKKSKFVFVGENGSPIDGKVSCRKLHAYCQANGLTDITPYRLRHTFGSNLKSELTDAQMRIIMGHSDAMDVNTYQHVAAHDLLEIGERLERFYDRLLT